MNDCITTTKQSTTKPCAYFLGYTVLSFRYRTYQNEFHGTVFAIEIEKLETELHSMEFHETLGFSILMSWAASLNSKVYNGIGSGPVSMRWATYGASRICCTYIVLIETWCPGTKCVQELNYLTMIKYRNRHRNGIQTEPKSPKFSFAYTPFVYLVFLSGKQQIVRYAKPHRPDLLPSSMCRYALPCAWSCQYSLRFHHSHFGNYPATSEANLENIDK